MPEFVRSFFKPVTGVIITSGVFIGGDPNIPDYYEESDRYVIEISDQDMTIGQLLEELKTAERNRITGTEREWKLTIKLQDSYSLRSGTSMERLDLNKTVTDYDLKGGSVIRLSASVR